MNSYRYRVTVEALADAKGQPVESRPLVFEVANHDDLLGIVERTRAKQLMDEESAAAMMIGLKLFAEVVMTQRKDPVFAKMWAALGEFIRELKQRTSTSA